MNLPPLVEATLLQRYKRFLADVRLPDGTEVVAHCPNPGRMTACWAPGVPCRVSHHPDPKRKLHWSLQQTRMNETWVLVNTTVPNHVVAEAIEQDRVPALRGYAQLEREVRLESSRIDLRLSDPDRPPCWVEVKNVTLLEDDDVLRFPDAVSARAVKHLGELVDRVRAGERAVLFFHVGRGDGTHVEPAPHIDPAYARALAHAVDQGVELIAHRAVIELARVTLGPPLEVRVASARA